MTPPTSRPDGLYVAVHLDTGKVEQAINDPILRAELAEMAGQAVRSMVLEKLEDPATLTEIHEYHRVHASVPKVIGAEDPTPA